MRFAVVGAGAIGSFVGASLARAGSNVTLVARGAHLTAMREHGVRIQSAGGDFTVRPAVTAELASVGPVDVVLLALKAHQIAAVVGQLGALLGPQTAVVAMQNGIPWWYFSGVDGPLADRRVHSVDPDGTIGAAIAPQRVVGCVIYCSAEVVEPGVIKHLANSRFCLGDVDGRISPRTQAIAAAFAAAGLEASLDGDIRGEIWAKLLGNAAFNPISALTRATVGAICSDPAVAATAAGVMRETLDVATALGVRLEVSIEARLQSARGVAGHRTSMLQDLEAGKRLELDALCGAVVELGALTDVPTPLTAQVCALGKLLEQSVCGVG